MLKTHLEKSQSPFLWALLILDTVWDELKNILSFGAISRQQRSLPIAPGEVLVVSGDPNQPYDLELAEHVTKISGWWGFGSARTLNTIDFDAISTTEEVLLSAKSRDERRPEYEPGGFPKVWLLTCRHGHEISLARRLRRHVKRLGRRTNFSHPFPFITAVPFIHFESTQPPMINIAVGSQVPDSPQKWTPTLGIFDTDIDDATLRTLPQPPQLTWRGTVIDQGQNLPLTVSTLASDREIDSHGTAVAAIAASKARVEIYSVGFRSVGRKAPWLSELSASFLVKALHTLRDCDVINLSLTVDQTVSDIAARFEDALAMMLEYVVKEGTIVVAAVGQGKTVNIQQSSGDYLTKYKKTAGIPASLSNVIAVGSDHPNDRNEGVEGPHIIVRLDPARHLCIVNGEPFLRSSAACAYVSGQICNSLGSSDSSNKKKLERAQEVQRRKRSAFTKGIRTNEVTHIDAT